MRSKLEEVEDNLLEVVVKPCKSGSVMDWNFLSMLDPQQLLPRSSERVALAISPSSCRVSH